MNRRVRLELDVRLDPGRGGSAIATPASMPPVDAVAQRGGCVGELDAGVDTLRLVRVVRDMGGDALAAGDEVAHGVGQVELALDVVRLEPIERRPEQLGPEDVDRGVALLDLELLGRRVARLDDRLDHPVRAANDPPVGARIGGHEREHGRRGGVAPVRVEQRWRSSVVSSGVSPERTSRSAASVPTASRAERTASPVPSAAPGRRACHRKRPGSRARRSRREAPARAARASSTQSTILRPRIGCRCFGVSERMRVPSPPAITTAANEVSVTGRLGRQDSNLGSRDQTRCLTTWPRPKARVVILSAVAEQDDERDDGEQDERDDRERGQDEREHRHEHDRDLRDGGDPGQLADLAAPGRAARQA